MINPEQWYTITELSKMGQQGLAPFKSRSTWLTLVKKGRIHSVKKGNGNKIVYVMQGKDIIQFIEDAKQTGILTGQ